MGPWLCPGSPTEEELRNNPRPWLTGDSVRFLEENVRADDVCIEFGGGWSSLWWAKKCAWTLTLEADHAWAAKLLAEFALKPELLTRWSMRFVASDWTNAHTEPKVYWKKHAGALDAEIARRLEDEYLAIPFAPTIFVIDGSVRIRNAQMVDEFLRTTNNDVRLVVVDNMESMAKPVAGLFSGFRQLDFPEHNLEMIPPHQNGKHITSVFVRD